MASSSSSFKVYFALVFLFFSLFLFFTLDEIEATRTRGYRHTKRDTTTIYSVDGWPSISISVRGIPLEAGFIDDATFFNEREDYTVPQSTEVGFVLPSGSEVSAIWNTGAGAPRIVRGSANVTYFYRLPWSGIPPAGPTYKGNITIGCIIDGQQPTSFILVGVEPPAAPPAPSSPAARRRV